MCSSSYSSSLLPAEGAAMATRNQNSSKGGWKAAIFIIFVEIAERFAYTGLSGNLISYLTNVLHQSVTTAAKNVNTWTGVSSLSPLIGAFIADSYFGRFYTIIVSCFVYFLGMVMLTLSVSAIRHESLFFVALYILSIGEGGHKPCVQTFAADQFNEDTVQEKETKASFFNWWYVGIVIGSTSAIFVIIYLQDNIGWDVGLGVLAGVLAVALILFLAGIDKYRKESPPGSPFTMLAQVLVASVRKWRVNDISDPLKYWYGDQMDGYYQRDKPKHGALTHTSQLRFLDKAMIIDEKDLVSKTRDPWRLCSVSQVEEVKLVLRLIPIWLSCLMHNVVQTQLHTFFTKQGNTMHRTLGNGFQIPPASMLGVVGLVILVTMPIYDLIFVPIARKFTGHPNGITVLQRIGIGLFLSTLTMVAAALVEAKRIAIARDHNLIDNPKATIPMSIWWMFPQYMICGVSDAFAVVGLQVLFYDQMPDGMRSLGAAAYLCILGVGSFVSNAIISIVEAITSRVGDKWLGDNLNKAHLDYFYWVLAGSSALNLCVFVLIASQFMYKKIEDIPQEKESDINLCNEEIRDLSNSGIL